MSFAAPRRLEREDDRAVAGLVQDPGIEQRLHVSLFLRIAKLSMSADSITVAENIRSLVVIKNEGPGLLGFVADYGAQGDLLPDRLRATTVNGRLIVRSRDEKPSVVAMEFIPTPK